MAMVKKCRQRSISFLCVSYKFLRLAWFCSVEKVLLFKIQLRYVYIFTQYYIFWHLVYKVHCMQTGLYIIIRGSTWLGGWGMWRWALMKRGSRKVVSTHLWLQRRFIRPLWVYFYARFSSIRLPGSVCFTNFNFYPTDSLAGNTVCSSVISSVSSI